MTGTRALRLIPGGQDITPTDLRWVSSTRVLSSHLDDMRWRNRRTSTIQQRVYTLARFARFIGHDPLDATSEEVGAFRDRPTRARRPQQANSQKAELSHLRAFFKWAVLAELRDDDPTARVPLPRLSRALPHPLPEKELARAIATAPDRIRPMFYLAAFAGLRACEIANLRGEDIWWHASPALLVVEGKGGDEQSVPIHPILEPVLRALPRRGWLFPRFDGEPGPNKPHRISQLCNAHLHRMGTHLTLHSCRHRFGTLVHRSTGGDLRMTQELMRHKSPVSTAIYTLVDVTAAAGAVAGIPALLELVS